MRLIGKGKPFEVNVKRFYLPGVSLKGKCPNCKEAFARDFGDHYLSYPEANKVFDLNLWCQECDHEWTVPATLNVSLELEAQ